MFGSFFGDKVNGAGTGGETRGAGSGFASGARGPAAPPARPSGAFASAQKLPTHTLIVVLPGNHSVPLDRISDRTPQDATELEVIVACAGQPAHATVTAIHAHLRTAQFLLAPAEMPGGELRALAMAQATGDIITLVDGIASTASGERPRGDDHAAGELPLSVVIPAHDSGLFFAEALAGIAASDLPRRSFELIVVDDASADDSVGHAARYADTIIRLKGQTRGAAYARNRGADRARGDIVAFVDADVRVRPDTLSKLLSTLKDTPHVGAVGASCDGSSGEGGAPAQYWNLLRQFGAITYGGTGIHFEAACGAVRRGAFVDAGMYNEWLYTGASVEDLDLGLRLHRAGHRVVLRNDVAVSHLRPHSLRSVLGATWRRSSLLTRTLSYSGTRALGRADVVHTLNSATGFLGAITFALIVASVVSPRPVIVGGAALALATLLMWNLGAYRFFARRRGLTFALTTAPFHVLAQMIATAGRFHGWFLRNAVGDPTPDATTQAFAEVGVEIWPPVPRKQ